MKIFSNFAGQKSEYMFDFGKPDIYLDPFVGNGGGLGCAIEQGAKTAWIAEKEISLHHLWQKIIANDLWAVIQEIEESIATLPLDSNDSCIKGIEALWSGTLNQRLTARLCLSIVGFNGLTRTQRHAPDDLWIKAYPWPTKKAIATATAKGVKPKGRLAGDTEAAKRASLRKRCQKDFANWQQLAEQFQELDIRLFDSSSALISAASLAELPPGKVASLIDPPYYVNPFDGFKSLTASYPGHLPHDYATWALCADAVDALFRISDRTYVTNYYSTQLHMLMAGWGAVAEGDPKLLKQCGYHAKINLDSDSGKRHRAKPAAPELTFRYTPKRNCLMRHGQLALICA
jgi:hypothetical protein